MASSLSMYLDIRAQSLKKVEKTRLSWSKDFFQKKLGLKINGKIYNCVDEIAFLLDG